MGYMVHRLCLVGLGRRPEDDRDHYANKRLDLGGPLLAGLFRLLFRKVGGPHAAAHKRVRAATAPH
jgi:DNA-directed RNA polymerase II subunit RPB2